MTAAVTEVLTIDHDLWQLVPWWHPRVWFCRNFVSAPPLMRRREWLRYSMGGEYDHTWHYADVQTIARQVLQERFDPARQGGDAQEPPQQARGGRRPKR